MPDQPTDQPDEEPENDDLFTGRVPILQALEKLRLRLLDLTRRNRLLNFKHSPGKCIQFVEAQPDPVYHRLMEGTDRKIVLLPIPEPPRAKWEIVAGRQTKPDAKDYARTLGIDPSFELPVANVPANGATTLQTLYYPEDLERYCRKLQREMKSALEETGAHMLFLVFGFIEFPEKAPSDRTMIAPLISVPVIIEKGNLDQETRRYRYHLSYTDEEVAENLSLKEKLRQEHGFELPDFNDNETTPEDYFRKLQQAIQDKDGWKLKRQMTLTLPSFTKMLLVRDIDPSKWPSRGTDQSELTDHPIVRMVFEGVGHQDGASTWQWIMLVLTGLNRFQNTFLLRLIAVKLETEVTKTGESQTFFYDLERGHFLGQKQHRFAIRNGCCNQIGNRLGLAGTGRTFNDHIAT